MAGFASRLARLLLRDALPPTPTLNLIGFGDLSGVFPGGLTERTALGLSAVQRSVQIIAGGVASLPWAEWRGTLELPPSRIVRRPADSLTRREWTWRVAATLALHNVAYVLKVGEDLEGVPLSLIPIPPASIRPDRGPEDPFGMLPPPAYIIGTERVDAGDVLAIRRSAFPGVSDELSGLLDLARIAFGSALAAEGYASRYWQAGGSPVTVITTDATLEGTTADDLAKRWRDRRAQGPDYPAVLGHGAKADPFGVDPTTASAVEARRELVADIGRYFGIGTSLLNAPAGDPTTYRTTESEGLNLIRFTLADYIGAIEDAISDLLPGSLGGGRQMRMSTAPLTRGEQLTRYTAYESALRAGWLTSDEVREFEGMGPLEDGVQSAPRPAPMVEAPAE